MRSLRQSAVAFIAFLILVVAEDVEWETGQMVRTTSGNFIGHPSDLIPSVSEYLGIPYAMPPTGPLRFAAPQAYNGIENVYPVFADNFSDDCPANLPELPKDGQDKNQNAILANFRRVFGQRGHPMSEDCLSLNVWTKGKTGDERGKAVLVWIHGGGFNFGSASTEIYNGARLAEENDVVVVSMNYRLNILGFAAAPGLQDLNVGILDQRMALKWTRENIAAFGGDPSRITLFGQSAGGGSVDIHAYAWPKNPIAKAFIAQSGAAAIQSLLSDSASAASKWFKISRKVGCGGAEAGEATIECMRGKDIREIMGAMSRTADSKDFNGVVSMDFMPIVDNKIIFKDYEGRSFAKKPVLIGSTDDEAGLFEVLSRVYTGKGLGRIVRYLSNKAFTCTSAFAIQDRVSQDVPIYRYRYYGDYPNTRLDSSAGAYHASELTLIFGTSEAYSDVKDTDVEAKVGKLMRQAWSEFAKNPEDGLTSELGWPRYDPKGNTLIRLGYQNETQASFVGGDSFDRGCGVARMVMKRFGHLLPRPGDSKDDSKDDSKEDSKDDSKDEL